MPYPLFDRSRLRLKPLTDRVHDLHLADILALSDQPSRDLGPALATVADRMLTARAKGRAVILMIGAHVLRRGNARFLIDLMQRGLVSHIAMNGAGAIHDFEYALIGATTESVPLYIKTGEFGMWHETGQLNLIAQRAVELQIGYGEAVGRAISEGEWLEQPDSDDDLIASHRSFPHADISVFAAGCRMGIPVTVHVAVGQDIIHQHPNCDGAAIGAASYTDFLVFTEAVCSLEGGVLLNFGSAVMGPEIYLKALSMARNVAQQEGGEVRRFSTAVFDLPDLGDDFEAEPPRTDPRYYYRPWKTILVRTVADGGESFYIQGDHRDTVPALYHAVVGS